MKELFLVTDKNSFEAFSTQSLQKISDVFYLPMSSSVDLTEEENEILKLRASPSEKYLAIMVGRNLIKQKHQLREIFVFEINKLGNDFFLKKKVKLQKIFHEFSIRFEFDQTDPQEHNLVFAD